MRDCIILTVNYLINLYSVLVAKVFEQQYHSSSLTANSKAMDTLEHYKNVRRMLPVVSKSKADGTTHTAHWGNHLGSKQKSFKATQGF